MTFAYTAFSLPDKPKSKDQQISLANITKNNLSRREPHVRKELSNKEQQVCDNDSLRRTVEQMINDGNVSGAVHVLLSEDLIAEVTPEVLAELHTKHSEDAVTSVDVTPAELYAAVTSFPNGSAGDTDGLRPQHLKDLLGPLKSECAN